jgi:pilus assembly protein CpaF
MSRLQQGISKLNSLSNHGSSISRLSSPSMGGSTGSGGKNYD